MDKKRPCNGQKSNCFFLREDIGKNAPTLHTCFLREENQQIGNDIDKRTNKKRNLQTQLQTQLQTYKSFIECRIK